MVRAGAEPLDSRYVLRDWIAGAALFGATAAVVLWQNAHVAVLFDVSYVLNTAARIALGQMPYRDFPLPHPPLTFLTQAVIIRLTGRVFFHHALYVALAGGLATVITWRLAFATLRERLAAAWIVSVLLAAPLAFVGIYCIVPNPEYDCDCALWILVALWFLQQVKCEAHSSDKNKNVASVNPADKDPSAGAPWVEHPHSSGRWLRGFIAGIFACVPVFFKQNMGLPFLAAVVRNSARAGGQLASGEGRIPRSGRGPRSSLWPVSACARGGRDLAALDGGYWQLPAVDDPVCRATPPARA